MRTAIKYLWASPVTTGGLVLAGLTCVTGGGCRIVNGTVEAWGGLGGWLLATGLRRKVACMTLGHVIVSIEEEYLPRFRDHERVHVHQYEKWGIFFVPLYLGSSLLAWMQGKHYYRDNVFEREAYETAPEKLEKCDAHMG